SDDRGRLRRDDAVHRRGEHRQLELIGPELPGDVDVVGVARAPRGHDRDVVESIGATALLAASDLNLHRHILAVAADEKTPLSAGPKRSEERRVGKEWSTRRWRGELKKRRRRSARATAPVACTLADAGTRRWQTRGA